MTRAELAGMSWPSCADAAAAVQAFRGRDGRADLQFVVVRTRLGRFQVRVAPAQTTQRAAFKPGDVPLRYWNARRASAEYVPLDDSSVGGMRYQRYFSGVLRSAAQERLFARLPPHAGERDSRAPGSRRLRMRQGAEVKLRWTIAGLGGAVFGTAAMVDETRLPIQVVRRLISRMVRAGRLTRLGPDRWKEAAGRLDCVRMAMRPRSEAVPREASAAGPQTPCDLPQEKP